MVGRLIPFFAYSSTSSQKRTICCLNGGMQQQAKNPSIGTRVGVESKGRAVFQKEIVEGDDAHGNLKPSYTRIYLRLARL